MLLRLIDVSKTYFLDGHQVRALKNVSLNIKTGEFVAIAGPSGSGKSTLMHIIGCLDKPTSGSIFLDGKDLSHLNEEALAKIRNKEIGFVFQQFNLLERTTALENVKLPLFYNPKLSPLKREQKARKMLKIVGLENRIYHFPNQLSGGQQQRVAIARALVNNPKIILADEPTGNLDSKTGKEIMKILTSLNKKGKTIIVVTHDWEIAKFAQQIIQIKDGRLVKNGI